MPQSFDERGERAIVRLRADKRFNEALYRELGPVRYWTQVRLAEEAIKQRGQTIDSGMIVLPEQPSQGRNHYTQDHKRSEDKVNKLGNGLPLEKATKERSKAVNIASDAILIAMGLAAAGIIVTIAAMICYGAWSWVF